MWMFHFCRPPEILWTAQGLISIVYVEQAATLNIYSGPSTGARQPQKPQHPYRSAPTRVHVNIWATVLFQFDILFMYYHYNNNKIIKLYFLFHNKYVAKKKNHSVGVC